MAGGQITDADIVGLFGFDRVRLCEEDTQYWEALTLLRRLEKLSDDALRPIAPEISHLLRDLRRITGDDARRETSRYNSTAASRGL
jgi:hypothetical protein